MSWDVVLFNSSQKIKSPEDVDDSKLIPIKFSDALDKYGNGQNQDDCREITGKDFSIVYYRDDEPTSNAMVNLYGETAIYQIINIAIKNNWQIFDTGLGEMINLDDPSRNGFKNFQTYLNQILNKE